MDIKQLESFVCIARMGSMTSASEVLYLSTPALAQQITRLEREVRVPLFIDEGDVITINTEDGSYVGRVTEKK